MKKFLTLIFIATGIAFTPTIAKAANAHPPGTLISQSGTIWQIDDTGKKRLPFDSAEKFYSLRLSFDRVVPANAADMALPEGDSPAWGNGVLFVDNNVIYQVSNGQKHGFTSAEVFLGQGFKFESAQPGNLSALPEGPAIDNPNDKHLEGTLLSSNGTIWTMLNGKAWAYPSEAIFFSHGGTYEQVVPANSNDSFSNPELLSYRTGSLINDSGAIWAISGNTKLGFPSVSCFTELGFSFSVVFTGSTKDLQPGNLVCSANSSNGSGNSNVAAYTKQYVVGNPGQFEVRMMSFDLSSGKVKVYTDTAFDQDCTATCPVVSLKEFAQSTGAQYGMNGTYFCPEDYSVCRSIANSFFWKIIDSKAGVMVNERSGMGENDPFLTFDSMGQPKYFSRWIDYKNSSFNAFAGINSPSLVENGQVNLDVSKLDDSQKNSRSTRAFIGIKEQTLYLAYVYGATVPDSANVAVSLGIEHALVMDGGGSNALLFDGQYKIGPGRKIPNAITVQVLP